MTAPKYQHTARFLRCNGLGNMRPRFFAVRQRIFMRHATGNQMRFAVNFITHWHDNSENVRISIVDNGGEFTPIVDFYSVFLRCFFRLISRYNNCVASV